jgi:signal transduction histidine kinase
MNSHEDQLNILIVDDSAENLRVLTDMLTEQGYLVRPAINGHVALKAIQNTLPDLILLDILMPGIDGYEVCRRLKADAHTKDVPVLFMSALNEVVDKVKAFEVGGIDYVTKPFYPEEVLARLHTHLALRRLHCALQEQNVRLQQEIIERTQAEEALKASEQQLQELNAGKDKLLSIIAHDLKGPLSSLKGLTQFAEEHLDNYTPEKLKGMIMMQRSTVENLLKLLENLLTWSRLQRGILDEFPQRLMLKQVFTRNLDLLAPMAAQKNLTLETSYPQKLMVYADYQMVDTIMRNLISNAIKFTYPGGKILIAARQQEQHVEISVTDTGIGIDAEHLPQLFRIDAKYKRLGTDREKGTGLGLILCKDLVEKNSGRIWIESEVGKGTTFTFTLPALPVDSENDSEEGGL